MKLAKKNGERIVVKFKDYQFFYQKMSALRIIKRGMVKESITAVSALQHYARDAGKSEGEIVDIQMPGKEIIFTAS